MAQRAARGRWKEKSVRNEDDVPNSGIHEAEWLEQYRSTVRYPTQSSSGYSADQSPKTTEDTSVASQTHMHVCMVQSAKTTRYDTISVNQPTNGTGYSQHRARKMTPASSVQNAMLPVWVPCTHAKNAYYAARAIYQPCRPQAPAMRSPRGRLALRPLPRHP